MRFGIIGSGSWATALAKILTDNKVPVNWWIRNDTIIRQLQSRHHNPNYISSAYFDISLLSPSKDVSRVIADSDCLVIASSFCLYCRYPENLPRGCLRRKKTHFGRKRYSAGA